MFFTAVYISSFFVLRAVFSVIDVSTLFTPYRSPVLVLGISLLLIFKTVLDLDFIVIELGFILKAIYYYSLIG